MIKRAGIKPHFSKRYDDIRREVLCTGSTHLVILFSLHKSPLMPWGRCFLYCRNSCASGSQASPLSSTEGGLHRPYYGVWMCVVKSRTGLYHAGLQQCQRDKGQKDTGSSSLSCPNSLAKDKSNWSGSKSLRISLLPQFLCI